MYSCDVDNWCATTHVCSIYVDEYKDEEVLLQRILEIPYKNWDRSGASVIMVTVNEEETELIDFLKRHKFKKGPWLKNWAHGGRRTCAFFKQLTLKQWEKLSGMKLGEYD